MIASWSPPDDPRRVVEEIAAAEDAKNALAAYQARLELHLVHVRAEAARAEGRSARRARSSAVTELSLARRVSRWRGSRLLGVAERIHVETPNALDQFRAGRLSEDRITLLVNGTRHVDGEQRAGIDEMLGSELADMSEHEAADRIRATVIEVDPHGAAERARRAEADRYLSARPAPDAMLSICALLPALTGTAVVNGLVARAHAMKRSGDERTVEQIKADTLAEAVLSYLAFDTGAADTVKAGTPGIQVQVVITDHALLSASETPARLAGYGTVPAGGVRKAIIDAAASDEQTLSLRRLWAEPETGELVAMESSARAFPPELAEFVRIRDAACRYSFCSAPIRQIDHVNAHHDGGPTSITNAQGTCQAHNLDKEEPGWEHVVEPPVRESREPDPLDQEGREPDGQEPDGRDAVGRSTSPRVHEPGTTIRVRTPTGTRHTTRPVALPHEPARKPVVAPPTGEPSLSDQPSRRPGPAR